MNNQKVWDLFSKNYYQQQKNPSIFNITLLNMLRINDAQHILDAGCGGGHLHQYILQQRQKDCQLTAFDFSLEMMKISAARMIKYIDNPLIGQLDDLTTEEIQNADLSKIQNNQDSQKLKENKITYFQGDVEDIQQIPDNSQDIYISNLVLQLIQNKVQVLKEALRVLKPGGRMGISISLFTGNQYVSALGSCLESANIFKLPQLQQNPLETVEGFTQFIKEQGFQNILCWKQTVPFDYYEYDEKYIFPFIKDIIQKSPQEKQIDFKNKFESMISEKLNNNSPFTVDAILLIATKPQ